MKENTHEADLLQALEFAARKHQKQRRKGAEGIPYINHPIEVTSMLASAIPNAAPELLQAALLHDTLEDTSTTAAELESSFGNKVKAIVLEVSDNMKLRSAKRKRLQRENAGKLSYSARCIRIADKTCNIRDILHTRIFWPRKRKIDYVIWAIQVVNEIRSTDATLENLFDEIVEEAAGVLNYRF